MKKNFLNIIIAITCLTFVSISHANNSIEYKANDKVSSTLSESSSTRQPSLVGSQEKNMVNNKDNSIKQEQTSNSNFILMKLKYGDVIIQLCPDKAPNHVERIKNLIQYKNPFYDGIVFHRVINGFMAQTGDPTGTGAGGSSEPNLLAEFNSIPHTRGVVSMARANDINSANSQFFIMLADAPHLDGHYTAFGKVVSGMEHIDQIKKGSGSNGMVIDPDYIISMSIMSENDVINMKDIAEFACQ